MTQMICSKCHHLGRPAKKKRGSGKVEFFMWMSFPFGIPYTLWRMVSKYPVCAQCGSQMLIIADSTVGRRLLAKSLEDMAPMMAQAYREESAETQAFGSKRAASEAAKPMHVEYQAMVSEAVVAHATAAPKVTAKPDEW